MKATTPPTTAQFNAYSLAFDYFNAELFDGKLPDCLLNFSRHSKYQGFFAPSRWSDRDGGKFVHEISLNPDLLSQPPLEIMGTLVHEMVHLWQQQFGKPSRVTYHNREWAKQMESVGLMPSHTGMIGGNKTGQFMSHYIISEGRFTKAFEAMPQEYLLPWISSASLAKPPLKRRDKVTYQCPVCGAKVWGKSGLRLACLDCGSEFSESI